MSEIEESEIKGYFWNTVAGLINASESVIMSMIVTRVSGLADAGMLSVAFAIGNLLMPIGKFGLRNYQITDIENQFSFSVYVKTRMVTVSLMIICLGGYLCYATNFLGYNRNKIDVICAITMIYAVEAIEDVVWAYYQYRGRLDTGAQIFCVRWTGILIVFAVVIYVTHNLQHTLLVCLFVSLILFVFSLRKTYPHICNETDRKVSIVVNKDDIGQIGQLLRTAFPLCCFSVLSFYVNNAPKYAIDACLTDEIQACYGFVAMPVFVIGLLNNFFYQPLLVPMAIEWEQRQKKKFFGRIVRQIFIVFGISIVCLLGAYWLGIPILSILYDTDLTGYKAELLILLLGSGFMATAGYESVVLTVMRCQRELLWPYCFVALAAAVGLRRIVSVYETLGAAVYYMILMLLLCLLYTGILIQKLRKA